MARLYFATNRRLNVTKALRVKSFKTKLDRDAPYLFRVGVTKVAADPGDENAPWQVGASHLYPEDPNAPQPLRGSAALFAELNKELKGSQRELVVYIHGFNTSFKEAMQTAAQIRRRFGKPGREPVVVVFSWPSNGRTMPWSDYYSDRRDAEASANALARFAERFLEFADEIEAADKQTLRDAKGNVSREALRDCGRRVNIIAHSMGTYALRHALQALRRTRGLRPGGRRFSDIFLVAPDEDEDALTHPDKLGPLTDIAHHVHLYHAKNDFILFGSDFTKGNPDRLGAAGPASFTDLSPRVFAIDCNEVSGGPGLLSTRHGYFDDRPEVVDDIALTLLGVPPDDRPERRVRRPNQQWSLKRRP
ncbi:MAG: alpha/beta fold hydrolase [Pseudomonadota bacterium]